MQSLSFSKVWGAAEGYFWDSSKKAFVQEVGNYNSASHKSPPRGGSVLTR